jgi:DivIVA domain-containing protein
VADDELSTADEAEELSSAPPARERGFGDLRHYVPADILNVSFPVSVRGYDRRAVDAYVKRVNRVIAELRISASPPAAVRHALEQAGQQVHGLLQSARETAEEITAGARQEAEESTARAKAEAVDLVVNTSAEADRVRAEADQVIANARSEADATVARAKTEADEILADGRAQVESALARSRAEADERLQQVQNEVAVLRDQAETTMREIQADTEAVWKERHELLDDIRAMASGLVDLANAATARLPRREAAEPEEEMLEVAAGATAEPSGIVTGESEGAVPIPAHAESRYEAAESAASRPDA